MMLLSLREAWLMVVIVVLALWGSLGFSFVFPLAKECWESQNSLNGFSQNKAESRQQFALLKQNVAKLKSDFLSTQGSVQKIFGRGLRQSSDALVVAELTSLLKQSNSELESLMPEGGGRAKAAGVKEDDGIAGIKRSRYSVKIRSSFQGLRLLFRALKHPSIPLHLSELSIRYESKEADAAHPLMVSLVMEVQQLDS